MNIGILGGGQLGLLLSQSLARLGAAVIVFDPDPQAPACRQAAKVYNHNWTDLAALRQFFGECDRVTYEFENVASDLLFQLEKTKPLWPSAAVLQLTADRSAEKMFLQKHQLPCVRFAQIAAGNINAAVKEFGTPCIIKTAQGGYDGKGQWRINSVAELEALAGELERAGTLIAEEIIDIASEVSCIVARSADGAAITFPIFENIHRDHILDLTIVPARIADNLARAVQTVALKAAEKMEIIGLLTVEFFVAKSRPSSSQALQIDNHHLLVNEFAPRPHNSGHVSMKACTISQFDALARILTKVPLIPPQMISDKFFCMGNLLGEVWLAQETEKLDLSAIAQSSQLVDLVLYGKTGVSPKRKMGHFITQGATADAAMASALDFRQRLRTGTIDNDKVGSYA